MNCGGRRSPPPPASLPLARLDRPESSLMCAAVTRTAAITTRDCPVGPRLGQATPLRAVRFAAHGLDRTAAPPGTRNYVMASRMTVALMRIALDSSSKESRRYDPTSRATQSASATSEASFATRSEQRTAAGVGSHTRSAGSPRSVRARAGPTTRLEVTVQ
jgi:hypothetical protein